MAVRWTRAWVVGVTVGMAGCAYDGPQTTLGFSTGSLAASSTTSVPVEERPLARKSMASKVLTAIALERVTGLKPDPARLAEAR